MQDLKPVDAKLTPIELCLSCVHYKLVMLSRDPITKEGTYLKHCDKKLDPNVIMTIGRHCSFRQEVLLSNIENT